MRSIAEVIAAPDFPARLDDINRVREARRQGLMDLYGWPVDANGNGPSCAACGDFGTVPGTDTPCGECGRGLDLTDRKKRDRDWQDGMSARMRDYTITTHPDRAARMAALGWYTGLGVGRGGTLVLSGGVGTGKTGLAVSLLRLAYVDGNTVQGGPWSDLLDDLRPHGDVAARRTAAAFGRCGLLLLDDLGTEKVTDWAAEQLYLIANERYNGQRPTIIGTNLTVRELAGRLGDRVASRLLSDADVIPMAGADRRRDGGAK